MKVSTSSKGTEFERRVAEYIQSWIKDGNSPYRSESCELFRQRSYYSKDRNGPIKFDVAVEVKAPGRPDPSTIVIFECKDLKNQVSIDDIEEFWAKLEQVGGSRCKGVVASTSGFQRSVLSFARSKGIGLVRFLDDSQVKWLLDRSIAQHCRWRTSLDKIRDALTDPYFESTGADVFVMSGTYFHDSLDQILNQLLCSGFTREPSQVQNTSSQQNRVAYIDRAYLEAFCQSIRESIGYRNGPVPIWDICSWRSKSTSLKVNVADCRSARSIGREVLGQICFDPPTITLYIDPDSPRGRFTLSHELGHELLGHGKYLHAEVHGSDDEDGEPTRRRFIPEEVKRLELQANQFASILLLPAMQFKQMFFHACTRLQLWPRAGSRFLFLDDQPCNVESYHQIVSLLAARFDVSHSVVRIRLDDLDLVGRAPSLKRTGVFDAEWLTGVKFA